MKAVTIIFPSINYKGQAIVRSKMIYIINDRLSDFLMPCSEENQMTLKSIWREPHYSTSYSFVFTTLHFLCKL